MRRITSRRTFQVGSKQLDSVGVGSDVPDSFLNYGAMAADQCLTGDLYFDLTSGLNWTSLHYTHSSSDFSTYYDYVWNA